MTSPTGSFKETLDSPFSSKGPGEIKRRVLELDSQESPGEIKSRELPAPVAQWLARRIVGRKAWGSNPIRVMWDFSALAGSYPELGVLWAQWEGWNHTAELHPLNGCVFEGVALII